MRINPFLNARLPKRQRAGELFFAISLLSADASAIEAVGTSGVRESGLAGSLWLGVLGLLIGSVIAAFAVKRHRAHGRQEGNKAGPHSQGRMTIEDSDFALPVPVMMVEYPPLKKELQALRDAHVTDLMSYLLGRPGLAEGWFHKIRIIAANRAALEFAGYATVEEMQESWSRDLKDPFRQIFFDQLRGLWEEHRIVETEESFVDARKQLRAYLMRSSFSEDYNRAAIVAYDTTSAKRTIAKRSEDLDLVRDIIARANIMLWWAKVHREGESFRWRVNTPQQAMKAPIYRLATAIHMGGLWDMSQVPDAERINAEAQKAMTDGWPGYHHEFRIIIDGQVSWISEDVVIQRISDDEWSLAAVAIDVTRIHEADEARQAAETQAQQILMKADCLVWQAKVLDTPEGVLRWTMYVPPSALYRRIFGRDPAIGTHELWTDQDIPEMSEMNERSTRAIRDRKPSYENEFRVRQHGQVFWMREQVTISEAAPGEWNMVGIITDISARREAEHALAGEKERLTVTLRAMTEGVITIDYRGFVQFINRAASNMTGLSASSAIGQPLGSVVNLCHASSLDVFKLPVEGVLHEGLLTDLPDGLMLKGRNDRSCMVEGCLAPVQDMGGQTIGAVLVMRDATERLKLEEHFNHSSKLESVGLLAGGIAHDFNNILTAVLGNISLAREDTTDMPETDRCLSEAEHATNRARALTLQLLTFSKGGDPVRSLLCLPQIISDAVRFALHGSMFREELDLASNLWPVHADKGQISQVLHNLVINSIQAMPQGGSLRVVARNIATSAERPPSLAPGNYVLIEVIDTGVGIKPENINRVFDPYYTTKSHGHGLGLSTAYSIIRKHQGHISLQSDLGKGSIFSIWLPAVREESLEEPEPKKEHNFGKLQGRILFMDDEEPIILLARKMMKRIGLDVDFARNGKEAIELYVKAVDEGNPYQLVVMDLTIPGGMGGRETLAKLKQIDPDVKAVVSSGYSGDHVLAEYKAHGFEAMIAKPYEIREVTRVLGGLLRSGQ